MAELSVEVTAKIDSLKKQLKEAEKDLEKFGKSSSGFGDGLEKGGKKGGKALSGLKKETKGVTPTLLEFNRVIQDAPFGIQGVANNLTQLTQNFGYLKQRTGSTGGAFKALLAGFTGPAGILFAVSAATSLFVAFGDKLKSAASITDELSKKSADFVGSAKTEIAILQSLVNIASSEANSRETREKAISRINDKYKSYLGNLDLESIKTDSVRTAIDNLTKSLIKQAQVRGVQALIEEKYKDTSEDLVKLQLKQKASAEAVKREVDNLRSSVAAFNNVSKDIPLTEQIKQLYKVVNSFGGQGSGKLRFLGSLITEFNVAAKETRDFTAETTKNLEPLKKILNSLTIGDLILDFDVDDNKIKNIPDKIKNTFKNSFKDLDKIFAISPEIQKSLELGEGTFQKVKFSYDKLGKLIVGSIQKTASVMKPALSEIELAIIDFNERASELIRTNVANTFSGIGRAIGTAISEGGNIFDALGKSLLGSLGSVLTQLGEMAIGIGVGLLGVQTALKSLNPYVAIAAGVGLVALGSVFSSSTKSIGSSFGSGGSSGVSGQGSSGGYSQSSSYASSGGLGGGRVVFEISGQNLVGVLSNTIDRNTRLGGNLGID